MANEHFGPTHPTTQPPHSQSQHEYHAKHGHHGHGSLHHSHAPRGIPTWRLVLTIALNFSITAAELIGGLHSGSLSLISNALHNTSDGIAIIIVISLIVPGLAHGPRDERYTFGLKRAQVFAALINAGELIAISFFLLHEALQNLASRFSLSAPNV